MCHPERSRRIYSVAEVISNAIRNIITPCVSFRPTERERRNLLARTRSGTQYGTPRRQRQCHSEQRRGIPYYVRRTPHSAFGRSPLSPYEQKFGNLTGTSSSQHRTICNFSANSAQNLPPNPTFQVKRQTFTPQQSKTFYKM